MRRNGSRGNSSSDPRCSRSSSLTSSLLGLAGGVGLGAGLLYLLDPDKGVRRRQQLMEGARSLGGGIADRASGWGHSLSESARSASDYAGAAASGAGGMFGGALQGVRNMMGGASEYAGDAMTAMQNRVCPETRAEHRTSIAIAALSSMAVGAALMYVFDPAMGRARRQMARERAVGLASQAGDYARQAASTAGEYAGKAGDAVRSAYDGAKDKVGSMTSGSNNTSSQTGATCPPGFTAARGTGADLTL